MLPAEIPRSIIMAVTNGMRISMKTSQAVSTGVSMAYFLYCPMFFNMVLSMAAPLYTVDTMKRYLYKYI